MRTASRSAGTARPRDPRPQDEKGLDALLLERREHLVEPGRGGSAGAEGFVRARDERALAVALEDRGDGAQGVVGGRPARGRPPRLPARALAGRRAERPRAPATARWRPRSPRARTVGNRGRETAGRRLGARARPPALRCHARWKRACDHPPWTCLPWTFSTSAANSTRVPACPRNSRAARRPTTATPHACGPIAPATGSSHATESTIAIGSTELGTRTTLRMPAPAAEKIASARAPRTSARTRLEDLPYAIDVSVEILAERSAGDPRLAPETRDESPELGAACRRRREARGVEVEVHAQHGDTAGVKPGRGAAACLRRSRCAEPRACQRPSVSDGTSHAISAAPLAATPLRDRRLSDDAGGSPRKGRPVFLLRGFLDDPSDDDHAPGPTPPHP
jgi:hypothetical protein